MRFNVLTLHNLASIEDAVIDFTQEPLYGSEVFLITGKTGSGKSTLLDAICLALYNKTPRMEDTPLRGKIEDGGIKDNLSANDVCNLLRRNTGEGWVRLSFEGNNGRAYEAEWYVARARKKPEGKLQSVKWRLQCIDSGALWTKKDEILAEVKEVVGLDFAQFVRTTLLAQGQFTKFLHSTDKEKAVILEKLTGVEIYTRLGQKVYALTQEKQEAWKAAKAQMEGVTLLTPAECAAKVEERRALGQEMEALVQAHKVLESQNTWLRKAQELHVRGGQLGQGLKDARAAWEAPALQAQALLCRQWEATQEPRARRKQMLQDQAQCLTWQTQHDQWQAQLQGEWKDKMQSAQDRLTHLEKAEAEALKQQQAAEAQAAAYPLAAHRAALRQTQEGIHQLHLVQERHRAHLRETERRQKEEKEVAALAQQAEALSAEVTREQPLVEQARILLEERYRVMEQHKTTVDKFAKRLRSELTPGAACPVCGQRVQTLPQEEVLDRIYAQKRQDWEAAEKDLKAAEAKFQALQTDWTACRRLWEERARALAENHGPELSLTALRQALQAAGLPEEGDLQDVCVQRLEALQAEQKRTEEAIGQGEALEVQARHLRKSADACRDQREEAQKKYQEAEKSMQKQAEKVRNLAGLIAQKRAEVEGARKAVEAWLQAAAAEGEAYDPALLEALNTYETKQVEGFKAQVQRVRSALEEAQVLVEHHQQAVKDLAAQRPDLDPEETPDTLAAKLAEGEARQNAVQQQIGALDQSLAEDRKRQAEKGALRERAEALEAVYNRWERLNKLLGSSDGDKFRKIAQSFVLESLLGAANTYMETLTPRYRLLGQVGTYNILIEDAYQGFARRNVSTVSGGESFLVSLALALALSDMGNRLCADTLFIDEGFGTLSGEALSQAINTLRSLHTRMGRHVGIISHVEELQERIPVQIRVEQEGRTSSSRVRVVG